MSLLLLTWPGGPAAAETHQDKNGLVRYETPQSWVPWKGSPDRFAPKSSDNALLTVEALAQPRTLSPNDAIAQTRDKLKMQDFKILSQEQHKQGKRVMWEILASKSFNGQNRRLHLFSVFGDGVWVDVSLMVADDEHSRYQGALKSVVDSIQSL